MDLDGMNKNPTYHRPMNLDHVGRERLASATSRHSGVCGLELDIAFFVTCRPKANLNLSSK